MTNERPDQQDLRVALCQKRLFGKGQLVIKRSSPNEMPPLLFDLVNKKGANIARERASRTHFYELGISRLHFLEGKKLLSKKAIYKANGNRSFIFCSH